MSTAPSLVSAARLRLSHNRTLVALVTFYTTRGRAHFSVLILYGPVYRYTDKQTGDDNDSGFISPRVPPATAHCTNMNAFWTSRNISEHSTVGRRWSLMVRDNTREPRCTTLRLLKFDAGRGCRADSC